MKGIWVVSIAVSLVVLSGCKTIDRSDIYGRYYSTTLKQSTSADVLGFIQNTKTEHLSQSESVVASWGDDYETRTHWFNMVAFDEELQTAARKYVVTMEDYRVANSTPRPELRLDAEVVMDAQSLNAAYPNTNAMRIEMVKKIKAMLFDDSQVLTHDSGTLQSSTLLANQTLNNLINTLNKSPGLAADLDKLEGMTFDQMTMGESRARLLIENDVVKLKIKSGPGWFKSKPFEKHQDVIDM